ncbi:MAG TPA: GGDEF domain-containing protein, partial [Candidatus Limnocylindrales bacterium]|nr:GGDEF domain-containing protein [Candidatus Limnocylindrales bacterium]
DDPFDAEADLDDADMDEEDEADMDATRDMPDDIAASDTDVARTLTAVPTGSSARGRDPLTGMLDASAFEEVMAQEDAREQRYGRPATVIVFELDGLTRLVDRLGTEPGDRIETALGDTIKRLARRADHVARLDRGRYAVLLPETDEVAAINYVERIRRACDLWLESGAIAMRLAIGWASTNGDAGLNGAIRVATDRMRQEMRRQARGVGDETPDLELIQGDAPMEATAGL